MDERKAQIKIQILNGNHSVGKTNFQNIVIEVDRRFFCITTLSTKSHE